jgi:putative ABC transport system ATP-binding protein
VDEMIRLENIGKTYRTDRIETVALQNVSLSVQRGEFISVMGPSGCGKSTLLNILGLLDQPSEGQVTLDGRRVDRLRDSDLAKIRNEHIGFVFQSYHLIADLTVVDNVEIPLLYRKMSGAERRRRAAEALQRVGLASRLHHFPTQLSGGQQQRVAIARAVVGRPRLILADEPTGNLDSHMGEEIMGILETLNREEQVTIIMVTHDDQKAARTARTFRIFDGQSVQ